MPDNSAAYRLPSRLKGSVLEEIAITKLREIAVAKEKWPASAIEMTLDRAPEVRSLRRVLLRRQGIIAEIKKASPSAGIIRAGADPAAIARDYEKAGAAAISVVTERRRFLGSLETLSELRWRVALPLLRKDFVIDPYQVLESRHAGADAVLLIAALLDPSRLKQLRQKVEELGMDPLVEVHDEEELEQAVSSGATFIGVNSRNLRSFEVSLEVTFRLAERFPAGIVAVAESGIRTADDVRRLSAAGYRGFLIGETLMRAPSPGRALAGLASALKATARGGA